VTHSADVTRAELATSTSTRKEGRGTAIPSETLSQPEIDAASHKGVSTLSETETRKAVIAVEKTALWAPLDTKTHRTS